jgi:hypothetical protein
MTRIPVSRGGCGIALSLSDSHQRVRCVSVVAFACPRSTLELVSVGATQAMYLTAGGEERECPLAVLDAREVAGHGFVRDRRIAKWRWVMRATL